MRVNTSGQMVMQTPCPRQRWSSTAALIGAMTAGDPASVPAINEVTRAMARIMQSAFPIEVDPDLEAATAKVLGHVWWSATISWANGMGDIDWVAGELRIAAELLADRFD